MSTRPATSADARRAYVISDADLRTAVLQRLEATGQQFDVKVERGEVYLYGFVSTPYEAKYLTHVVQQVAGVRVVRANLRIGGAVPPPARRLVLPAIEFKQLGWGVAAAVVLGLLWFQPWRTTVTVDLVAAPVQVRVDQGSAAGAMLTLYPLQTVRDSSGRDLSGLRPRGFVRQDGSVEWTTLNPGDGIPPGQYVVTAIWQKPITEDEEILPGPNLLPEQWTDPASSPLRLVVSSEQNLPTQSLDLSVRKSPHRVSL